MCGLGNALGRTAVSPKAADRPATLPTRDGLSAASWVISPSLRRYRH
jgi:hypothetical protein